MQLISMCNNTKHSPQVDRSLPWPDDQLRSNIFLIHDCVDCNISGLDELLQLTIIQYDSSV